MSEARAQSTSLELLEEDDGPLCHTCTSTYSTGARETSRDVSPEMPRARSVLGCQEKLETDDRRTDDGP